MVAHIKPRRARSAARNRDAASRRGRQPVNPLKADDAFVALLIAAMDANGHVSAEEAARAHHIIWSMRRFRRRSGETIGRKIDRMRSLIERHGPAGVIEMSATTIPTPLRRTAFALATDLLLVDGRLERAERRFLRRLAEYLRLNPETASGIVDVIRVKNSA